MVHCFYLVAIFLIHTHVSACISVEHLKKIVFLISPPRSLSTAALRLFENHKDFSIFLEPSLNAVYENKNENVFKTLLDAAMHKNVFIKEIADHQNIILRKHPDLVKNKNVYVYFLFRHPHGQSISHYNKSGIESCDMNRYEDAYNLLSMLQEQAANTIKIILSEELSVCTEKVLKKLCEDIEVEYSPSLLLWQYLETDCVKQKMSFQIEERESSWFLDAINSTSMHAPTKYDVDDLGNPTFKEIALQDLDVFKHMYKQVSASYQKILETYKDLIIHP